MLVWWEIVLRLLSAVLIGAIVGWERETRGKPAGLRTLSLVSLASAVYVLASQQAALSQGEPAEPMRAMAGIAQGVGFIGAGAILQARGEVRWLTTAAALWAVAAVGFACGMGMYMIAIVSGLLVFVVLRCMAVVEERWIDQTDDPDYEPVKRKRKQDR